MIRNKLIENEFLIQIVSTIITIAKIISNALDTIKDLFLAVSILIIVGGPEAVWNFPTYFGSIIAVISFGTIFIPLALSTLQLVVVDPWAILTSKRSHSISRTLMTFICFLFSWINPILLLNAYQSAKEDARRAAKENAKASSKIFDKYRVLKAHFVEHLKIELGKTRLELGIFIFNKYSIQVSRSSIKFPCKYFYCS